MKIFKSTNIPFLSKALDGYSLRQKAINSNIANINTPGYKSKRVRFEEELQSAGSGKMLGANITHSGHIPIGVNNSPRLESRTASSNGNDIDQLASGINDVDIDKEMAEMAENQLKFRFASRMITGTFKGLQKSIRGQQ